MGSHGSPSQAGAGALTHAGLCSFLRRGSDGLIHRLPRGMGWAAKGPTRPAAFLDWAQPQGARRDGPAGSEDPGADQPLLPAGRAQTGATVARCSVPLARELRPSRRPREPQRGTGREPKANLKARSGWARGGVRPWPLEGARDPQTRSLRLLGRAGARSPPPAWSCPGNRAARPLPRRRPGAPSGLHSGRKPRPEPQATASSPGCRPPRLDAGERRPALSSPHLRPAGSKAPSGPGGRQSVTPKALGAGLPEAGLRCRHRPRLGPARCKHQRDRKMDSICRAPGSHPGSSAARGGAVGPQGGRPRVGRHRGPGLRTWQLLANLPGNGSHARSSRPLPRWTVASQPGKGDRVGALASS